MYKTMEITRNNYELYAIDFLEGNLKPSMKEAFRVFLIKNPEIEERIFEAYDMVLSPPDIEYASAESLKKTAEDLTTEIHEQSLSEPELLKFILKPGNEKYPDKKKLKKPLPIIIQLSGLRSAAAIFLLLILVKSLFNNYPQDDLVTTNIITVDKKPFVAKDEKAGLIIESNTKENEAGHIIKPVRENTLKYKNPSGDIITVRDSGLKSHDTGKQEKTYKLIAPMGFNMDIKIPSTNKLDPPIIYIPRILSQQDLLAFEAYTIEDFRPKLIDPYPPAYNKGEKIATAIETILELTSSLTGGNLDIKRSYNESGKLASLNLSSENISFIRNKSGN